MKQALTRITFMLAFLFFLVAGLAKILHYEIADQLLIASIIVSYICTGYVLHSFYFSHQVQVKARLLWAIGVFIIGWPFLLFYIFITTKNQQQES